MPRRRREAMGPSGLDPIPVQPKKRPASKPECSSCGAPSAAQTCSGCLTASYCSRDCQKGHWKCGHKQQCAGLKQLCTDDTAQAVAALKGTTAGHQEYAEHIKLLDEDGTYLAAVAERGLHPTILKIWADELELRVVDGRSGTAISMSLALWRNRMCVSALQDILKTVVRAQRRSGQPGFGKMDGGRCADLIYSRPDAWPIWLQSTLALGELVADEVILAEQGLHERAHRAARDSYACLTMALARIETAKAIIDSGHIEWTAATLRPVLAKAAKLSNLRNGSLEVHDPNQVL